VTNSLAAVKCRKQAIQPRNNNNIIATKQRIHFRFLEVAVRLQYLFETGKRFISSSAASCSYCRLIIVHFAFVLRNAASNQTPRAVGSSSRRSEVSY